MFVSGLSADPIDSAGEYWLEKKVGNLSIYLECSSSCLLRWCCFYISERRQCEAISRGGEIFYRHFSQIHAIQIYNYCKADMFVQYICLFLMWALGWLCSCDKEISERITNRHLNRFWNHCLFWSFFIYRNSYFVAYEASPQINWSLADFYCRYCLPWQQIIRYLIKF